MRIILIRKVLNKNVSWTLSRHICTSVKHHQEASSSEVEVATPPQRMLSSHPERQPQRKPFMKNVFLGKFDSEFLAYPETQITDRYKEFQDWISQIEIYLSQHVNVVNADESPKEEILSEMKSLNVFGARMSDEYSGYNLNETELYRLTETLSVIPWLGAYYTKNNLIPIDIISKYSTKEQKSKYLPKIATGEFIPTLCCVESLVGSCSKDINATATLSNDNKVWTLNGRKSYVANGKNSNLFIVIANTMHFKGYRGIKQPKSLAAFIVEADFGGIICEHVEETIGQYNVPMCVMKFENTRIPAENIIGQIGLADEMLLKMYTPGNQNIAGQAIGILKNFINLITPEIVHRKHLDKNMFEYQGVQGILGQMSSSLYAMESVAYLTAGVIDTFADQDVELEKAITEHFCANECLTRIYEGLQLIGPQSYLKDSPYIHILQDALMLTLFDRYNLDAESLIGLLGSKYAGSVIHNDIFNRRVNIFSAQTLMKYFIFYAKNKDLGLQLHQYLHPSFCDAARLLEECVQVLYYSSTLLLEYQGAELSDYQLQLSKLCEMATLIYVLIAVLGRASKAYCNGNRFNDSDRIIALMYATIIPNKINVLRNFIEARELHNGSVALKTISETLYKEKKYFLTHPTSKLL